MNSMIHVPDTLIAGETVAISVRSPDATEGQLTVSNERGEVEALRLAARGGKWVTLWKVPAWTTATFHCPGTGDVSRPIEGEHTEGH